MDRMDALAWLIFEIGPLYQEYGRNIADGPDGFGPVIDAAARSAGVSNPASFTIDDDDIPMVQAFLRYYALRPLLTIASIQTDASVDAPLTTIKDRGTFKNLLDLFNLAKREAEVYGLNPLDTMNGFLRWNTDWVEPVEESTSAF